MDHTFLAYSVDYKGDETYTVKMLNLKTGEYCKDVVEGVAGGIQWGKDNSTFLPESRSSKNDHTSCGNMLLAHRKRTISVTTQKKMSFFGLDMESQRMAGTCLQVVAAQKPAK